MPTPQIDAMPPAPEPTNSREVFSARTFAFYAAMANFIAQFNAGVAWIATQLATIAGHATNSSNASADAVAAAAAAAAAAGAAKWVSGAAYADGAAVWSPITYRAYRRKGAGSGVVDPSIDTAAWAPLERVATGSLGAVNLNTVIQPGLYAFTSASNGPAGVTSSQLIVSSDGDTATQIITDKATGAMFVRGGSGLSGSPAWSPWRRVALHNDIATAIAGGVMDCSAGNRFTVAVSANTTLSFSNIPVGAYACVLEVNHTGGTITLPAGCVIANGDTLSLTTGKRHLLYFERCQLGTAGWYVSTLANYAA